MNSDDIMKLAVKAGLLNYVDNETPKRYFIDGNADIEDVQKFADLIAAAEREECAKVADKYASIGAGFIADEIRARKTK